MEGGESNALLDFSGNSVGDHRRNSDLARTGGHDGNGAFEFNANNISTQAIPSPPLLLTRKRPGYA